MIKKLIELNERERFKNNICNLINDKEEVATRKENFKIVEVNSLEEIITFRDMLIESAYLTNLNKDKIKETEKHNMYPIYIVIDKEIVSLNHYRDNIRTLNITLYKEDFIDFIVKVYKVNIYKMEDVIYNWI